MDRESWMLRVVAAILFFMAVVPFGEASMSISRVGCGDTKLCLETPNSCYPNGSSPCLFTSIAVDQAQVNISLRGNSSGYVALGLTNSTQDQGMSTLFACALNGSEVFFRTVQRNNSDPDAALSDKPMPVMNFKGNVNDSVITCMFSVPPNVTSLKSSVNMVFTLLLGTGDVDTDYSLQAFKVSLRSEPLDLMNIGMEAPTTAAPATTAAPPPTTTPATLSISRNGCGESKLCVETPQGCDPNGSTPCLFTSAAVNKSKLSLSLRGESAGFVALGLTKSKQKTTLFFVCGKRNGSFFFETALRNNSVQNATLVKTNTSVEEVKGEVNGNVTKCVFKILNSNIMTKSDQDFTYSVSLAKGAVNGDNLVDLDVKKKTAQLDLSNPKAMKGPAVRPVALLSALILPILLTVTLIK